MPKPHIHMGSRVIRTRANNPTHLSSRQAEAVEELRVRARADAIIDGVRDRYGKCELGI